MNYRLFSFQSLISCIMLIKKDEKYEKFIPSLDQYITGPYFCQNLAYNKLLELLKDCIEEQCHYSPDLRKTNQFQVQFRCINST